MVATVRAVFTHGHAGQLLGHLTSIGPHANLRSPIMPWIPLVKASNKVTLVTSPTFVITRMLHFLTVMAAIKT